MQLVLTFNIYTIYKRVLFFGLDFYMVQKHLLNLSLTGKTLEKNPVKIKNRTLSY